MKYFIFFLLSFFKFTNTVCGQEFNKAINKDSLFLTILKDVPEPQKSELQKMYNEGNDQTREFYLMLFSMPRSSKKELISNIDSNFDKINLLKTSYLKLVPKNYTVSIEFNPADKVISTKESIDLGIEHRYNNQTDYKKKWKLEYNSKILAEMIEPLGWTTETLITIKKLLAGANCVSIENGNITTIGFARSGMGKYSFKLFDSDLNSDQIKKYNDGCTYIYHKKNIVLEYGGGAIGSQCFPD
jgi:hypothetical protein